MYMSDNIIAILKAIVVILGFFERQLLELKFENCLEKLGTIIKSEIFVNSGFSRYLEMKR